MNENKMLSMIEDCLIELENDKERALDRIDEWYERTYLNFKNLYTIIQQDINNRLDISHEHHLDLEAEKMQAKFEFGELIEDESEMTELVEVA